MLAKHLQISYMWFTGAAFAFLFAVIAMGFGELGMANKGLMLTLIAAFYISFVAGFWYGLKGRNLSKTFMILPVLALPFPILYIVAVLVLVFLKEKHPPGQPYDWRCLACDKANDKAVQVCTGCGCPARPRAKEIEAAKERLNERPTPD